jgi:hypothetical protein
MKTLDNILSDPRLTVRRSGEPDPDGGCVVYWMQRAQRAVDNPALTAAIHTGNCLGKPVVVFFQLVRHAHHANYRHYQFLVEGLAEIAVELQKRKVGFVVRRYPDHGLLRFCSEVRPELDQAQSASVGESVALEALGTLSGADKAVTDAVPIIDELRFGSAYSSRTGRTEPTITIGKRLAERIRANVTSGVAESREIRSNVEWQLSPRVSVEGSYDNVNDISSSSLGNLGADVRWRMEFE